MSYHYSRQPVVRPAQKPVQPPEPRPQSTTGRHKKRKKKRRHGVGGRWVKVRHTGGRGDPRRRSKFTTKQEKQAQAEQQRARHTETPRPQPTSAVARDATPPRSVAPRTVHCLRAVDGRRQRTLDRIAGGRQSWIDSTEHWKRFTARREGAELTWGELEVK